MHVAAYDPDWPRQFAAERSALEKLLAPWLSGPVEHIGSTAVPGLDATPILDMLAPVSDLAAADAAIPVLARRSYVHAQHRPGALYFFRPATPAASGSASSRPPSSPPRASRCGPGRQLAEVTVVAPGQRALHGVPGEHAGHEPAGSDRGIILG